MRNKLIEWNETSIRGNYALVRDGYGFSVWRWRDSRKAFDDLPWCFECPKTEHKNMRAFMAWINNEYYQGRGHVPQNTRM